MRNEKKRVLVVSTVRRFLLVFILTPFFLCCCESFGQLPGVKHKFNLVQTIVPGTEDLSGRNLTWNGDYSQGAPRYVGEGETFQNGVLLSRQAGGDWQLTYKQNVRGFCSSNLLPVIVGGYCEFPGTQDGVGAVYRLTCTRDDWTERYETVIWARPETNIVGFGLLQRGGTYRWLDPLYGGATWPEGRYNWYDWPDAEMLDRQAAGLGMGYWLAVSPGESAIVPTDLGYGDVINYATNTFSPIANVNQGGITTNDTRVWFDQTAIVSELRNVREQVRQGSAAGAAETESMSDSMRRDLQAIYGVLGDIRDQGGSSGGDVNVSVTSGPVTVVVTNSTDWSSNYVVHAYDDSGYTSPVLPVAIAVPTNKTTLAGWSWLPSLIPTINWPDNVVPVRQITVPLPDWFDGDLVFDLDAWPVVGMMRTLEKWIMYLCTAFGIIVIVRKGIA